MADLDRAISAAREALRKSERGGSGTWAKLEDAMADLLAALDAAQPAAWVDADTVLKIEPQYCVRGFIYGSNTTGDRAPLYLAPQAPPAAVPAALARSTLEDVRSGKFHSDAYADGWNDCRTAMIAAANKENGNG